MSAVPAVLVALAVVLGLPPLVRRPEGAWALALAALAALGVSYLAPPAVLVVGPVAFLADGPALLALAGGALAARHLPRQVLFFIALAALAADLRLYLLALLGLVGALPAGRRRDLLAALPILALLGLLLVPSGFALDLPGSTRGVLQLRAFAALGGLLLVALPLVRPRARPALLAVWLFALVRYALPLWPEAGPTLAPIVTWVAGGGALLAAGLAWVRPGWAAGSLLGTAVVGALTATSPGLTGAVLLAAALALLPSLAAAPLALAGGALALHAGWWAVPSFPGPVLLAASALALAAIPLIRKAFSEPVWVPTGLAAALATLPAVGLPPPGAEAVAARSARRSLTADDVGGWRRLSRARAVTPPQDAGVP